MNRKSQAATAVGATIVFLALAGGGMYLANTTFADKRAEHYTVAQPISQVVVAADSGDIDIVATDADQISVRQTRHWLRHEPKPTRTVEGGVLRLGEGCPGGFSMFRCETDFRIELPRAFAGSITID